VVVAAGNDFVPLPNAIVGDNPNALIVAATDEFDVKADFSNSGAWIGVTAPGVHILSTMPTYEVYLTSDAVPADERFQQNYDYMSGTSQATPLVSGLAALLFSAHPDWDAGQVSEAIKDHAADISQQNRRLAAKGFLGSGRIDACAALGAAAPAPTADIQPTTAPIDPTPAVVPTVPAQPRAALPEAPDTRSAKLVNARLLLLLGAGGFAATLLLALLIFALVRAGRRPRLAAAPPMRTPPLDGPQHVAAHRSPAVAWGALSVVGGPAGLVRYPLAGAEMLIGREDNCFVQIVGDATVSRRHAIVRNDGRQITVIDAGSTHGTYLNGRRVLGIAEVRRGMVLQVGQTLLRFE
jgi:hypothetical protein